MAVTSRTVSELEGELALLPDWMGCKVQDEDGWLFDIVGVRRVNPGLVVLKGCLRDGG